MIMIPCLYINFENRKGPFKCMYNYYSLERGGVKTYYYVIPSQTSAKISPKKAEDRVGV